jgi:hypothetical protein
MELYLKKIKSEANENIIKHLNQNISNQTNKDELIYRPLKRKSNKNIGVYRSNGSADGSPVYCGIRGGTYYINKFGNVSYVDRNKVDLYDSSYE